MLDIKAYSIAGNVSCGSQSQQTSQAATPDYELWLSKPEWLQLEDLVRFYV